MTVQSPGKVARVDRVRPLMVAGAVVGGIVIGRTLDVVRPADERSPLVIATHLYAVVLAIGLLWLAGALGRAVLRRLGVQGDSRLEQGVFAITVGLGLIATIVVLLGLFQVLTRPVLGITVLLLTLLVRHDLSEILGGVPSGIRCALKLRRSLQQHGRVLALLLPLTEILFVLLLVRALAPPWENDVLTYHLEGPRRFLELGRVAPIPDIEQADMPLAVNMLYLLGLAAGSDELGAVLHVVLAGLVTAATFGLARRCFGERIGWIAATTFVSTPLLVVFGGMAFVDYGLALFDFSAVYAFLAWRESGRRRWLIVSGFLVGCALASKYLGGITALSLGVWLLATVVRERRQHAVTAAVDLLRFGLPAAVIAAPWYLRNLLWFGNPVWPFLAGNANDFNMYLGGTTRFVGADGIVGVLMLPIYLYSYGSVEFPAVRPPLQLLMIPLYAMLPKHRAVTALLALAAVQFLAWSQGAHVLRYWLPALPGASIVAAYVLGQLTAPDSRSAIGRRIANSMILVGLAFPVATSIGFVVAQGAFAQLVGLESQQAFLDRKLDNNRLVAQLNGDKEPVSRVLMIGDNRSFYLEQPSWVDVSMEVFQEIALAPDARTARARLVERGISHVLINSRDLFFYVPIDPERRILTYWERFEAGRAGYLEPIATSGDSTLYRVIP